MLFSGVMILAMGLEFKDLSPDRAEEKPCPARIPDNSLMVVPLLPTSNISLGGISPRSPLPCTRIQSGFSSISIPIFRKQLMVDRQSAPLRKCVISVVPCAIEPSMMER